MQGLGLQDPPPHNSAILSRFIRPAVGVCKLGGAFPKCFQSRRPPTTLEKSIYIRSGFRVTPRIFLRLSAHHREKKCFPTLGNHAVHHPRHLSPSGCRVRGSVSVGLVGSGSHPPACLHEPWDTDLCGESGFRRKDKRQQVSAADSVTCRRWVARRRHLQVHWVGPTGHTSRVIVHVLRAAEITAKGKTQVKNVGLEHLCQ